MILEPSVMYRYYQVAGHMQELLGRPFAPLPFPDEFGRVEVDLGKLKSWADTFWYQCRPWEACLLDNLVSDLSQLSRQPVVA